jgi:hypothetical protein
MNERKTKESLRGKGKGRKVYTKQKQTKVKGNRIL